jgi:hypothetical protein
MGVSLLTAVTHRFQSNDGNYCPSEGTGDDNASAKDDRHASSDGLSNDVAAVADTSVAATARHHKTTVDKDVHEDAVADATVMRPRTVTIIEKSIILMMHSFFRFHAALTKPFIQALTQRKSRASISDLIAHIVRQNNSIVASTWTNFIKGEKITQATIPGNRTKKATHIPHLNSVILDTQSFVCENRHKHERIMAKDVLSVLERNKHITVDQDSPKAIESATRAVRRFIRAIGYERVKNKGLQNYQLKQINRRLRDEFIILLTDINADPSRQVVTMDDSYIHHHYKLMNDSIYDPNDEYELLKEKHNCGRFCFSGALIDADERVPIADLTYDQEAQMIVGTMDFFRGGKQTKDYHGMFDGSYFLRWFEHLLFCLKEMGFDNAAIVMDNAKYHKCLPQGTKKGS